MYSSQLKSVSTYGDIKIIDTNDLNPYNCFYTLSSTLQNFNINIDNIDHDLLKISYNFYKNRFWRNFPRIEMEYLHTSKFSIVSSPLELYDYLYNHWSSSKLLDIIEIENKKFAILIYQTEYTNIKSSSGTINIDDYDKQGISHIIRNYTARIETASELYEKHALSQENLIEFFHENKKYYDIFMKLLEVELRMVEKLAPHKMEKWKSYKKLCV